MEAGELSDAVPVDYRRGAGSNPLPVDNRFGDVIRLPRTYEPAPYSSLDGGVAALFRRPASGASVNRHDRCCRHRTSPLSLLNCYEASPWVAFVFSRRLPRQIN
jgi:hypothetical protein